jgi:hypothetical protein
MSAASDDRGLGRDGWIRREGSLDRVAPAFGPVIADVRGLVAARLGTRLHSAYLYGSIPRGTAVPGVSDLDAVILLRDDPPDTDTHASAANAAANATDEANVSARRGQGDAAPTDAAAVGAAPADAAAVAQIAVALDKRHEIIDGAGLLCWPVSRILDPAERYDLGFFLACLCTPLLGQDVARRPGPCWPGPCWSGPYWSGPCRSGPGRRHPAAVPLRDQETGTHWIHPRNAPLGWLDQRFVRCGAGVRGVLPGPG